MQSQSNTECLSKGIRVAVFVAFLTASQLAAATCYSLFDSTSQLVFQSEKPPFDVSGSFSEATQIHFPSHYLITDQTRSCEYVNEIDRRANVKKLPEKPLERGPIPIQQHNPDAPLLANGSMYVGSVYSSTTSYTKTMSRGTGRHAGTDVYVKAYTRRDGTYVPSHTRAARRR
jgi:hypothetical protein